MANKKRLIETLAYICTHPHHWNQGAWRCQTGMCFAGHAAVSVANRQPVVISKMMANPFVQENEWNELVFSPRNPDAVPLKQHISAEGYGIPDVFKSALQRKAVSMSDEGQHVLGLDSMQARQLFAANNTLDEIADLIAEFTHMTRDEVIEATKAVAKENGWRWRRKELAERFALNW